MARSYLALAAAVVSAGALAVASGVGGSDGVVIDISNDEIERSGESQREWSGEEFDQVELRGPDRVVVTRGAEFSVNATGSQEALSELEFEVRNDRLIISRTNDFWDWGGDDGEALIEITAPTIRGFSLAGSGDVEIDRIDGDSASLQIAGSGNIDVATVEVDRLELDIAGSGDMELDGTADRLEVNIAGSGNVEAADLTVERAEVNTAGSGDAVFTSNGDVEANLLGSGDVQVRGDAECDSSTMGSGELTCG